MLVLTPKYNSQIDLDLLKKQKDKKKDTIVHRNSINLNWCKDIFDAYLTYLEYKSLCESRDYYIVPYVIDEQNPDRTSFLAKYNENILDVSWWDVSNITNMSYMFFSLNNSITLIKGLEKWDVSNCENMSFMFANNSRLTSISDISRWDVSRCKSMSSMFYNCRYLKNIGDISGWDVSNVSNMTRIFAGCMRLENIGDISGWDVKSPYDKSEMFVLSRISNIPFWA